MFDKPRNPQAVRTLQSENKKWWTHHPMNYDWHGSSQAIEGTDKFFREIDQRFFRASPLFHGKRPFAELIPYEALRDRRVLEIGCGLGSHSQLLAECGCNLTSIDLTSRAVALTTRRLKLNALAVDVREMDAECLDFADAEFDFVWSWGVIHHSARTDQIVREVSRVLKPGGEFRLMVYNRRAFDSYIKILRGAITGKFLQQMSVDDVLSFYTDGFLARFYDRRKLKSLIEENGLRLVSVSTLGQTSELVPLPGRGAVGRLKYGLISRIPDRLAARALRKCGSFLFAVAWKPTLPSRIDD